MGKKGRFEVDLDKLELVYHKLQVMPEPVGLNYLATTPDTYDSNRKTVARYLLENPIFQVEHFSLGKKGVLWDEVNNKKEKYISPIAYLSYLLSMSGDMVIALFGPPSANDRTYFQWSKFPAHPHGVILERVRHYLETHMMVANY